MDRFDRHTEYIMERGKQIIAKRKQRAKIIKRFSFCGAGLCTVAIIGVFTLHNIPSAPERTPDVSELISADITTSGYVSAIQTTVSETTVTNPQKTIATTMKTTSAVSEKSSTVPPSQHVNTSTITTIASVAETNDILQSTAVSTERSIVYSHSESTSTSLSSTPTVSQSVPFESLPMSETASYTTASDITTTTFSEPKHYKTASVSSNKLSDIIGYGKEIVYNETVYTSDFLDYSMETIDDEIGEYGNIPIYSLKMFSSKIKLTLGINDKFYSFSNKNYSVKNLNEFIIDIGWERFGNIIEYGMSGISGDKADHAVNDILFADAEMSEYSESPPSLSEKQAAIYSNSPFTVIVYENGYLQVQVNSKNIYFQIGEEKAKSFFEYLNQTE